MMLLSIRGLRLLALTLALMAWWGSVSEVSALSAAHQLQIELVPTEAKLIGTDVITVHTENTTALIFRIAKNLANIEVAIDGRQRDFNHHNDRLQLNLTPQEQTAELQVRITYNGIFNDPVPVRPVNADNPGYGVTGTISPGGSFLLAGAGWYPELADSQATYRVSVKAPAGLIAVTAGRSEGHVTKNDTTISTWVVDYPVRGLALSVARYVVREKPVGKVTASTYLLAQNQHLADSYLNATIGYIALYTDLFGTYPFEKFAVVENFFPTGFGFPSYTLMGGTVLRLPFIVHTSLGHEIAHCWWGNGVYVDYRSGNWSEGLTSYVADYLYQEMKSAKSALDARRQWLKNYASLVPPQNDFALSRFQSRYNPLTKTVGYDKSAMVFHMIRQIIGEEAFWGSLRDIFRTRLYRKTSWSDLQLAFEHRSQHSLQNFFDQWIYRKGAPRITLDVAAKPDGNSWHTSGEITQEQPYYQFPLELALETDHKTITKKINVSGHKTTFEFNTVTPPVKLSADPNANIFRRLFPSEIPPTVNSLKSSFSVITILSSGINPELKESAKTLALSLGLKHNRIITEDQLNRQLLVDNDILMIGRPKQKKLLNHLPSALEIRPTSFILEKKIYDNPADVFFGVFSHPFGKNRKFALFMPLSAAHAEIVAAKITHYGRYSYLAFQGGKNAAKGYWPVERSPLVYWWSDGRN